MIRPDPQNLSPVLMALEFEVFGPARNPDLQGVSLNGNRVHLTSRQLVDLTDIVREALAQHRLAREIDERGALDW